MLGIKSSMLYKPYIKLKRVLALVLRRVRQVYDLLFFMEKKSRVYYLIIL